MPVRQRRELRRARQTDAAEDAAGIRASCATRSSCRTCRWEPPVHAVRDRSPGSRSRAGSGPTAANFDVSLREVERGLHDERQERRVVRVGRDCRDTVPSGVARHQRCRQRRCTDRRSGPMPAKKKFVGMASRHRGRVKPVICACSSDIAAVNMPVFSIAELLLQADRRLTRPASSRPCTASRSCWAELLRAVVGAPCRLPSRATTSGRP